MVFNGSGLVLQLSFAGGGCEGGGLWRNAVDENHGIALFYNVFNDFELKEGICSRWEFPPCGRLAGNDCFTKVA